MQQYFVDGPLQEGVEIELPSDKAHHALRVLKLDHETVRLVCGETGYFAEVYSRNGKGYAKVLEKDPKVNELQTDITLCMALIRREKFELVLQKATELGVRRIVPFESSRCVVHLRQEKTERLMERWNAIVTEASEQCKRNRIPQIETPVAFEKLDAYRSTLSLCAYEKEAHTGQPLSSFLPASDVTVVIGPEGGFSEKEVELLSQKEFGCVTLGTRILRAETAAMYACAVIGELSR